MGITIKRDNLVKSSDEDVCQIDDDSVHLSLSDEYS